MGGYALQSSDVGLVQQGASSYGDPTLISIDDTHAVFVGTAQLPDRQALRAIDMTDPAAPALGSWVLVGDVSDQEPLLLKPVHLPGTNKWYVLLGGDGPAVDGSGVQSGIQTVHYYEVDIVGSSITVGSRQTFDGQWPPLQAQPQDLAASQLTTETVTSAVGLTATTMLMFGITTNVGAIGYPEGFAYSWVDKIDVTGGSFTRLARTVIPGTLTQPFDGGGTAPFTDMFLGDEERTTLTADSTNAYWIYGGTDGNNLWTVDAATLSASQVDTGVAVLWRTRAGSVKAIGGVANPAAAIPTQYFGIWNIAPGGKTNHITPSHNPALGSGRAVVECSSGEVYALGFQVGGGSSAVSPPSSVLDMTDLGTPRVDSGRGFDLATAGQLNGAKYKPVAPLANGKALVLTNFSSSPSVTTLTVVSYAPVGVSCGIGFTPSEAIQGTVVTADIRATLVDSTNDWHPVNHEVIDWGDATANTSLNITPDATGNFTLQHVYATAGTYTATLVASDTLGQTATSTASIQIDPPPTVAYNLDGDLTDGRVRFAAVR